MTGFITDYVIVGRDTYGELSEEVRTMIQEGKWQPMGAPFPVTVQSPFDPSRVAQAMVQIDFSQSDRIVADVHDLNNKIQRGYPL